MNKKLQHNISKDYVFTFLNRLDLTQGIWMLYLASLGLSLFEIGLMETIYHLTSFTMEVPTGIIADLYGRKFSRVLGRLFNVFAVLIILLGQNVYWFALSFICTAIGNNLESGAGEALIYDSLVQLKQEDSFMKINGIKEVFQQSSSTIALLLGGFLATINYSLVYVYALIISCITLAQTFSFQEPDHGKIVKESNTFKTLAKQLITSIQVLRKDHKIAILIIFSEVFAVFYTSEFFYIQNLMKLSGNSEFVIGIILALGSVGGALMALLTHRLAKIFNAEQLLIAFPLIAIVAFWLINVQNFIGFAFIVLSIIEGGMFITISDYINRLIPSEQRATILSFQSMLFSLLMIVVFPLIGKIGDLANLRFAFIIIAICATISLSYLIYIIKKINFNFN